MSVARAAPTLTDAEVLAAAHDASLPARFEVAVTSRALWPTVAPGARLVVERAAPWPGAVACVVSGRRLAWRRVVAVRGGEALLRAEVAPFDDGWFGELVGCAAAPGALGAVAARAPAAYAAAAWWSAVALAHLRGAAAAVRARRDVRWATRALGPDDEPARRALLARVHGGDPSRFGPAPGAVVGLFAPGGALAGEYHLRVEGTLGRSSAMVVEPAWRGRGGGAALARGLVEEARRRGLGAVRCAIAARNLASVRAHRGAGFSTDGRWVRWPDDPLLAAERQWLEFEARP